MEPPIDPPGISRDRYCSPNVTLETAWAVFVELERFEGQRWEFMFWKGDPKPAGLEIHKLSIATKNQPFSQGGWSGCGSLIATSNYQGA